MRAQLCVRSVLRLLRRLAYADFHRQQFTLTSISCAAQRSGPEIIKPDCDTHMRISAADAVCCIESHPAQVGNTRLGPRMTHLLLGDAVTAEEIAADIASGDAEVATRRYKDVGDVLAHSALKREGFPCGRCGVGWIGIKCDILVQTLQHEVQGLENVVSAVAAA